jgi:hypothetical protein
VSKAAYQEKSLRHISAKPGAVKEALVEKKAISPGKLS